MSAPIRFGFWLAVVTASCFLGYCAHALASAWVGRARGWLFDLVAVAVLCLTLTPLVWWMVRVINRLNAMQYPPIWLIGFYVLLPTAMVFAIRRLAPGITEPDTDVVPPVAVPEIKQPRLLRRLAGGERARVLRISAKGHYVIVVTERSTCTVRLRLGDAIEEMTPVEGHCVHRSHWVTRDAIQSVERENAHKLWLILENGDKVPVGRKHRPALEQAGIL